MFCCIKRSQLATCPGTQRGGGRKRGLCRGLGAWHAHRPSTASLRGPGRPEDTNRTPRAEPKRGWMLRRKSSFAASPAEHTGGRGPGADLAIAQVHRLEREAATVQVDSSGLRGDALGRSDSGRSWRDGPGPRRPLSEPTDLPPSSSTRRGSGSSVSCGLVGPRPPYLWGSPGRARDTVFAGLAAFVHMGDPSRASRVPVGPPFSYWGVTGSALLLAVAVIVGIGRLVSAESRRKGDDPTSIVGLADHGQVKAVAGATALLARASTLRPSARPVPADVGFSLGTACGVELLVVGELDDPVLGRLAVARATTS